MSLSNLIYKPSLQSFSDLETPEPNLLLPLWASWNWSKKYLPNDIHTKYTAFAGKLNILCKYTFKDHNEGILVVLSLVLLLHECWRAVEAKGDDENIPQFVWESLLYTKRAEDVIQAIKMVIDANEKRQKEKEFDGSAKGKKAKAGQKKGVDDSSQVENARSQ
jgi:hypothetical protein